MADVPDSPAPEESNVGPCPEDISGAGARLWEEIASGGYWLRPDERALLAHLCRQESFVEILQRQADLAVETGEYHVQGSQGQPVINPIFSELRMHRALVAQLARQLGLPDPAPPDPPPAQRLHSGGAQRRSSDSDKATAAAHARWRRRRG